MPKQELDLFQFSAGAVAQFSAGPAQVVRRYVFQAILVTSLADDVPDHILANAVPPNPSRLADSAKHSSFRDAGCGLPPIERVFDPLRHGNGANVAAFADQIDDGPMPLPGLHMLHFESGEFCSA
jgi:hypothetical protein